MGFMTGSGGGVGAGSTNVILLGITAAVGFDRLVREGDGEGLGFGTRGGGTGGLDGCACVLRLGAGTVVVDVIGAALLTAVTAGVPVVVAGKAVV